MLEIGTKAPAFELPDQNGEIHTLEEYKGKKVVLYFYPKMCIRDRLCDDFGYERRYMECLPIFRSDLEGELL